MKVFRVLLLLAAITMALPLGSTATADQTSVTVIFQQDQFLFDRLGDFDRVVLRDGDALVRTGQPMLPARQIMVALPQGAEAVKVTVRSMNRQVLDGHFRIFSACHVHQGIYTDCHEKKCYQQGDLTIFHGCFDNVHSAYLVKRILLF